MNPLLLASNTSLAYLESRAKSIAQNFMSTRASGQRSKKYWSDLVIKVDIRDRRLRIEWRTRIWLSQTKGAPLSRRYIVKHVSNRALLKNAKDHEREEVQDTRRRLADIKRLHTELLKLERDYKNAGLLLSDADREIGFIPIDEHTRIRSADGRFTPVEEVRPKAESD